MSKQMNDQKGSFQAKKIKNDRPVGSFGGSFKNGENSRPSKG